MQADAFAAYKAAEVAEFAADNVRCGRWPAECALGRSLAEFDELLPQGLATPQHHLLEILASDTGPCVGTLWWADEERAGGRAAFVYDIVVQHAFQRQGHARRALIALESQVAAQGLSRISLHVAGDNPGAQALYRQLGFGITGVSMLKQLGTASG